MGVITKLVCVLKLRAKLSNESLEKMDQMLHTKIDQKIYLIDKDLLLNACFRLLSLLLKGLRHLHLYKGLLTAYNR